MYNEIQTYLALQIVKPWSGQHLKMKEIFLTAEDKLQYSKLSFDEKINFAKLFEVIDAN